MNELFNTLFNTAFDDSVHAFSYGANTFIPDVDVSQTESAYKLEMDLPGRSENDINLELDHNVLTISSVNEKAAETEENKKAKDSETPKEKWLLKERHNAAFKRSFSLPDDIDSENVAASFKNGVLNVIIPRKAAPAPKKIAITA